MNPNDPFYAHCECGHGALMHEGEYGCLGAGPEPGDPCPCSRMYPVPSDDDADAPALSTRTDTKEN